MVKMKMIHICNKTYTEYLYRGKSQQTADIMWKQTPKGYIMEVFEGTKLLSKKVKK